MILQGGGANLGQGAPLNRPNQHVV